MTQLKPEFFVTDESALRAMFPPTQEVAVQKCLNRLERHSIDFITRAPFLCIGTQSTLGTADVSPRGDPSGFVKVLDDKTLLIPDRPGNNRLDTLSNITTNPNVGLLFVIPGFDETLRINGTAQISFDPDLLALVQVQDRTPTVAIIVTIKEVFLHCAKAFRRSKLWDPAALQNRNGMPGLLHMIKDQTTGTPTSIEEAEQLNDVLEEAYRTSMY